MNKIRLFWMMVFLGIILFQPVSGAWNPAQRLTWSIGDSSEPAIAVDANDTVHIAYFDDTLSWTGGYTEVYYKRSTDRGSTWSGTKRITWGGGWYVDIAAGPGANVHLVWVKNDDLYYKKSTNGGVSWGATKRLTWTPGQSYAPAICATSTGHVLIVFSSYIYSSGQTDVYFKRSWDGGSSWSSMQRFTYTSAPSRFPDIAVDGSNIVHVVWYDTISGNEEIFYKKSSNNGGSWTARKRLTWLPNASYAPSICGGTISNVYVVWHDLHPVGGTHWEIYFKSSTDSGVTWSTAKRLTYNQVGSVYPDVYVDANFIVHVVWEDFIHGNEEIYYKNSTDGGYSWSSTQRLTYTTYWSERPKITGDSVLKLHVTWSDNTPGRYELFYKRRD